MKNILVTGGSGLIGRKITEVLQKEGFQVAWLSRSAGDKEQKAFSWDVDKQTIDPEAVLWADAVIHLAGTGIAAKRWSSKRKQEILNSRVKSSQLLLDTLKTAGKRPGVIVAASAIGYYGMDTGDTLLNEKSPSGNDFLAEVTRKWEEEILKSNLQGIRTVCLRIGIVLAAEGGALAEMMKPPIAAPLGDGKQILSWIHIEDLARIFAHALKNENMKGIYNAVGTQPVQNQILTKKAAKYKKKPYVGIGVPSFVLRLALGEMASIVLGGNKVSSQKIQGAGFEFQYTQIDTALKSLYNK